MAVHYCAMGNQPRFKYDPADSTATELFFDFAGGTNVDAAKDAHVHAGRLFVGQADQLEEEWTFWKDGQAQETGAVLAGPQEVGQPSQAAIVSTASTRRGPGRFR